MLGGSSRARPTTFTKRSPRDHVVAGSSGSYPRPATSVIASADSSRAMIASSSAGQRIIRFSAAQIIRTLPRHSTLAPRKDCSRPISLFSLAKTSCSACTYTNHVSWASPGDHAVDAGAGGEECDVGSSDSQVSEFIFSIFASPIVVNLATCLAILSRAHHLTGTIAYVSLRFYHTSSYLN